MDYKALYDLAMEATKYSYAPYSNFKVGAAVVTEDDQVYTGGNIENASYGATICAERVAMGKAISEGHRKFKAVVVAAQKDGVEYSGSPCGICRQFIFEFGDDIEVVFGENRDKIKGYRISELLKGGFRL